MLGEKLKELREAKGLVQRQVAAALEVDTAYISKMESNEKPVSRMHLFTLANLFNISEEELVVLWLAERLYSIVKDEPIGLKSVEFIQIYMMEELKNKSKKRIK